MITILDILAFTVLIGCGWAFPFIISKSQDGEEMSWSESSGCDFPCTHEYFLTCASDGQNYKVFTSKCLMKRGSCLEKRGSYEFYSNFIRLRVHYGFFSFAFPSDYQEVDEKFCNNFHDYEY